MCLLYILYHITIYIFGFPTSSALSSADVLTLPAESMAAAVYIISLSVAAADGYVSSTSVQLEVVAQQVYIYANTY
jgi:hypothetical protein